MSSDTAIIIDDDDEDNNNDNDTDYSDLVEGRPFLSLSRVRIP